MVEVRSIGEKRLEYLDLANKAYSSGDVETAQAYMDNFLATVRDGTETAKDIEEQFNETEKKKITAWEELVKETAKEDIWMQTEQRYNGRIGAEYLALKERLNICWQIAVRRGLFND